ncbi:CGEA protein [Pseudalkalibacillus sp. SCS-8]|uniref:CGEA protein n=1 Tax=Pseudalkalibacillus nanhaiensis TaxID=3115291 RepID=UPI0032DB06B4
MSLFEDGCCEKDVEKTEDRCRGCICEQLKKLDPGTQVEITGKSGNILDGKFIELDKKTCCVKLLASEVVSPFEPEMFVIISCEDIESLGFPRTS